MIPQSSAYVLEADSELFNRKLRLVSNVTASDTRAVKLAFSKGQLDIHARSSGCGEASAQMEIKYKGKAAEIAFNPDYLMDGLKNCESDTVQFEFNESTAPLSAVLEIHDGSQTQSQPISLEAGSSTRPTFGDRAARRRYVYEAWRRRDTSPATSRTQTWG